MFPCTTPEPQDDHGFLAIADRIILGVVQQERPEEVYLIHVDNWFGPKWLRYSGKGVVAFPYGYAMNIVVALADHYQDQLTFPPFTGNRIVGQHLYARTGESYEEYCPEHLVHRRRWRWKEQKLHRRVERFSDSGIFAWYSSRSLKNRKGSLMVYSVSGDQTSAWYAGFTDDGGWRLDQVSGTSRDSLMQLISPK